MFEFDNPLLIRGYGIVTSKCDEEEDENESLPDDESEKRDPKSFKLDYVNFLDATKVDVAASRIKGESEADNWVKLHKVENGKWTGRYEEQKFNFEQKLVTKLRLRVSENFGSDVMQIAQFKLYC